MPDPGDGDAAGRASAWLAALAAAPEDAAADRLASLVAKDFQASGPAKGSRDWAGFLAEARARGWPGDLRIRRADAAGATAFVEAEEAGPGGGTDRIVTVTVFEFQPDGRLRRLDRFR